MEDILLFVCGFNILLQIYGEPHPPVIINDSDKPIIVSEQETVGKLLAVLEAEDEDGDNMIINYPDFDTEAKSLVIINQTKYGPRFARASIYLNQTLDRDYHPDKRLLYFQIEDTSINQFRITVGIELIITDVNDEVPVFQNLPYRHEIREDERSDIIIYTKITAIDPDLGKGGKVLYSMEPITQSIKDAVIFNDTFRIDNISGTITLKKSLDYERIQFFQFKIFAVDGMGLSSSEVLTIRVLDIQDTPPEFTGTPYVVTILENMPINSSFYTIRAMDGDQGIPNDIRFRLSAGPCRSSVRIDDYTGELTVTGLVDRDTGEVMEHGGLCEITVEVSEVQDVDAEQYGETTATEIISIFVTDENDNSPYFNADDYSAYIEDTAQLNYPIQLDNDTELYIEDKDQGSSGILELILRSQDGDITYDFEPIPNVIASHGTPLIALKSPDLLKKRKEIVLKLYAIERDTSEKNFAVSTITIRILPVATTTVPLTTIAVPTPTFKDSFIPSVIAAVVVMILLIWAIVTTCYICTKYSSTTSRNNKVGHHDLPNGKTQDTISTRRLSVTQTDLSRRNDVSHA
ncbi:Cadherin-like [Mactra antiquata]